ncbi:hypothetical protein DFP72DRAFT_854575 [Ephemerocybe angulata]|uniref:Uncharacterized protein n=1 Tax=Ephemerocybe angulata TaxID=980116 RepID=A0A8H6LY91_9AGAR|nr:hypothetical protein DFP72DRAFT_854575 [Tulosesus angulatus]
MSQSIHKVALTQVSMPSSSGETLTKSRKARQDRIAESKRSWKEYQEFQERKHDMEEAGLEEGLFLVEDESGRHQITSRVIPKVSAKAENPSLKSAKKVSSSKRSELKEEIDLSIPFLEELEGSNEEEEYVEDEEGKDGEESEGKGGADQVANAGANIKCAASLIEGGEHTAQGIQILLKSIAFELRLSPRYMPPSMSYTADVWAEHSWRWATLPQRTFMRECAPGHQSLLETGGPVVGLQNVLEALDFNWFVQWPMIPELVRLGLLPPEASDHGFDLTDAQEALVEAHKKALLMKVHMAITWWRRVQWQIEHRACLVDGPRPAPNLVPVFF